MAYSSLLVAAIVYMGGRDYGLVSAAFLLEGLYDKGRGMKHYRVSGIAYCG